ncbi:hypothetical protein [Alteromonas halophila]|uniref:SMODS and SLOG-associating 2TM effector domain-containing protein n=1 Tax=Alteromonas halophila TaxID=516698 RepID=A0A918MWQ1_9ALTE|nr:hypothetical protein [Alteromonas halophila]GGW79431.1 hypothetical protein GCM10007391_10260 [Alteromonas halophila]
MNKNNVQDQYARFAENPLVPMTLRVAVAGHRENANIRADNAELVARISHLYDQLHVQLSRCHQHPNAASLYADAPPLLRLISSMADGADRLLIEPALVAEAYELACILPFSADEYARDFDATSQQSYYALLEKAGFNTPQSRVLELDGDRRLSDFAYRDCAENLVRNCDLLVALYDGKERPGYGTAWTVNLALAQKIPVIWIDSENPDAMYFIHHHQGKVRQQTFSEDALYDWLGHVLLFDTLLTCAENGQQDPLTQQVLARFSAFASETCLALSPKQQPDFNDDGPIRLKTTKFSPLQHGFALLKRFFTSPNAIDKVAASHRDRLPDQAKVMAQSKADIGPVESVASHGYFAAYLRADRLASYYAAQHRSTFVFIYLLGAAALIVAALAIALSDPAIYGNSSAYCAAVELALLLLIYGLFRRDKHKKLHDRWLEYRCIAEFLRPSLFLSLLGSHFPMRRYCDNEEVVSRNLLGHGRPERCWAYLYTETVLRYIGFSGYKVNHNYLDQVISVIRSQWIAQQYQYHTRNAIAMNLMGRRLARISERLFAATIVIVCLKVASGLLPARYYLISKVCGVLAAWFPVLGTTAFAIRNHAEFDISAQRSLSARETLLGYNHRLQQLSTQPVRLKALDELLRDLTAESITETASWLEIYEVKETETV